MTPRLRPYLAAAAIVAVFGVVGHWDEQAEQIAADRLRDAPTAETQVLYVEALRVETAMEVRP